MRILALFYLFLIYPTTSTSQTNADSVVHMTDISLKYLNSIFITHNVDSASSLWDKQVFLDITGGYMECDVSYQKKTKNEIIQKFKLDIIQFKGLDNQVKFKVQDAGLISMNDSDKLFFITFYISFILYC